MLIYLLVAVAWILLSDRVLEMLAPDWASLGRLQTFKGIFYVLATAALLYQLIRRDIKILQRQEHTLRELLEAMPVAVVAADAQGKLAHMNRAARVLMGMSPAQKVPDSLLEAAHLFEWKTLGGEPAMSSSAHPPRLLEPGEVLMREGFLTRPDGVEIHAVMRLSTLRDERTGEVMLNVAAIEDVTRLRHLEKLRDDFLATAAHELKTPVTTIKTNVQLLQRWNPEGHEPREGRAFTVINRQCDRLNRILVQLLEVSRLGLSHTALNLTRFAFRELVEESIEALRPLLSRHTLVLELGVEARMDGDRDRLQVVVANLLDNAVRYSPDGGEIKVILEEIDDELVLEVQDHGLGIPKERSQEVFQLFARVHASDAPYLGGLGLGLYLSREIIDRHRGRIWFHSEPGLGSHFFVALPLAPGGGEHAG